MSLMKWSNDLSVNIAEIDNQHKKLVELINGLHAAMSSGKGKEALQKVFDELVAYTKSHFTLEEDLMKKHSYSEYAMHKMAHDRLTKKVLEYHENYKSGKISLSVEVYNFLKEWLTTHISGTDKKYSPFLNARGVS